MPFTRQPDSRIWDRPPPSGPTFSDMPMRQGADFGRQDVGGHAMGFDDGRQAGRGGGGLLPATMVRGGGGSCFENIGLRRTELDSMEPGRPAGLLNYFLNNVIALVGT